MTRASKDFVRDVVVVVVVVVRVRVTVAGRDEILGVTEREEALDWNWPDVICSANAAGIGIVSAMMMINPLIVVSVQLRGADLMFRN